MSLKFLLVLSALVIAIDGHYVKYVKYEKYDPQEDINYVLKNEESVLTSCCTESLWNVTFFREIFDKRQKRASDFECDTPLVDNNLIDFASNVSTFAWDDYKLVCILI